MVKKANSHAGVAEEAPVVEHKKQKAKAVAGAGFVVYLGPTIRGVVQNGTIFPGTKKNAVESIVADDQLRAKIAELIVDGSTLPVDRLKVKTPGNLLYVKYHQLAGK